MKTLTTLVIFALTLITAPAMAADQGTAYGAVLDQFDTITEQFSAVIDPAAKTLFWSLVVIDISIFGIKANKGRIEDAGEKLLWRIFFYGFIFAVMNFSWLLDICQSFAVLGMKGAGFSSFNPADQMREGLNLIAQMVNKYNSDAGGSFAILKNPFAAITMGLCVILTLVSYMILVAQYLVITLQMNIYATIAPLLLALGGLRYTKDVSLKVMSASIVIGVRMLVIFFVLSFAKAMTPLIGADIAKSTIDNILPLLSAVSMAGLLAFLAIKAPTLATDLLNGTSSLSAGDTASMPGVAAAAGAAAGAITGGISSAASAAGKAASTSTGGFTPLREAVAAASGGNLPSSASGSSGLSPTGAEFGGNSGSGFSSRNLAPSWMTTENLASAAAMGGDSAGTNSGTNRTGFNSGASTNSENSGSRQSNNNAQTRQNQDANKKEIGSTGAANGSVSGVNQSGSSSNFTSSDGWVGPNYNSSYVPQNDTITGVNGGSSEQLVSAAHVPLSSEGGSIGGAGGADATGQASQPNNSAVADHVSRGLQEFAQAEKSAGASVNIQAGHEDI